MKNIYLNLKRFDVPRADGGVNDLAYGNDYADAIVKKLESLDGVDFTVFFQEAYIIEACKMDNKVNIGCQSVFYDDVEENKNFGAFTTFRTAKSMKALGVNSVLIGHCEERNYLNRLNREFGGKGDINTILNEEVKRACAQNMHVLYCIGEKAEEQDNKYEVLRHQLEVGLKDVDLSLVSIAYEPVWAIGPGKTPPGEDYIRDIAIHIKSIVDCKVVYGGGLKKENAKMIASIEELDGGLVALTRFGKDFGFYLNDFEEIVETYKKGL